MDVRAVKAAGDRASHGARRQGPFIWRCRPTAIAAIRMSTREISHREEVDKLH